MRGTNNDRRRFLVTMAATIAGWEYAMIRSSKSLLHAMEARQDLLSSLRHATTWLNSAPLTAGGLRGKVVLIDFCTYTCINWLRQLPYVRAWADKYRNHGLVVIGVHTPEFGFESNLENVRRAIPQLRVDFPIAVDNDYSIWDAFDNRYWPALYFIDAHGQATHHHFGEGAYEESERTIQRMLKEAGAGPVDSGLVAPDARGIEAAADWDSLASPEIYLGLDRTERFASTRGARTAAGHLYDVPTGLRRNEWALAGDWSVGKQAVALNQANGRIACRFRARDLHLVLGPRAQGQSVRFRVRIDGQAPAHARGSDINAEGEGAVTEPRLYQLIRQTRPIPDRDFEIEFLDPGVEAFAFTFG